MYGWRHVYGCAYINFLQQLASLALGGVNKSVSRQSLCDFIASCGPTLKTIRLLDSQRVDGHVVSTVAETCKKLLVLSLSGCSSVREDDLMPLCNGTASLVLWDYSVHVQKLLN